MTSEQKYEGKANNANPIEQTGSETPQAANNAPLTASHPDFTDAQFIEALQKEYSLTPDDRETVTGLVQRGYPRELVERTARRFGDFPTLGAVVNQLAGTKTKAATPPPAPKAEGDLSAPLGILVNARFGTSHADVLIFALSEYQDSRLKQAMASLADGDYEGAVNDLSDSECAKTMLLELALSLSKLSDRNYWATRGESPRENIQDSNVFETYAKYYFGFSDERIREHVAKHY